jgi:hypothetical protein
MAGVLIALHSAEIGAGGPRTATDIIIPPIPERAEVQAALVAAIALLPQAPKRVAVMDVTGAKPGIKEHLLTLDAFILRDSSVIYVVQQSDLLQRARSGARTYCAMLAAVLWHEMSHLAGADERTARQAEEDLWTAMVRDGVVERRIGLRYLQALRKRPSDRRAVADISKR